MYSSHLLNPFMKVTKYVAQRNAHQVAVGAKLSITRAFTQKEVTNFAKLVGDTNPIHIDKDYASKTVFKKPIVHGVLTSGLFSQLVYKLFGDGAVLLNLNLNFIKPVYVGEEVVVESEVISVNKLKVAASLKCFSKSGKLLVEGIANGSLSRHTVQTIS